MCTPCVQHVHRKGHMARHEVVARPYYTTALHDEQEKEYERRQNAAMLAALREQEEKRLEKLRHSSAQRIQTMWRNRGQRCRLQATVQQLVHEVRGAVVSASAPNSCSANTHTPMIHTVAILCAWPWLCVRVAVWPWLCAGTCRGSCCVASQPPQEAVPVGKAGANDSGFA